MQLQGVQLYESEKLIRETAAGEALNVQRGIGQSSVSDQVRKV